jgi:hypothetical protein
MYEHCQGQFHDNPELKDYFQGSPMQKHGESRQLADMISSRVFCFERQRSPQPTLPREVLKNYRLSACHPTSSIRPLGMETLKTHERLGNRKVAKLLVQRAVVADLWWLVLKFTIIRAPADEAVIFGGGSDFESKKGF